jgi:hypothetical protein
MPRIDELFTVHRAKSGLFAHYASGDVAYVGNGLSDNAVSGFVTPRHNDKVFDFAGIAISAFCEASVQVPPYVACGRAGNGVAVLQPKASMTTAQMAYIAAYINMAVRWRFNWYRQTTVKRIESLTVPDTFPDTIHFDVASELPFATLHEGPAWNAVDFSPRTIGSLYELVPGEYHSLAALGDGPVPVVSCGDADNGISAYCSVPSYLHRSRLTIAFNGMNTLTAKYHPYQFAAKDDVAVCEPREPLKVTTQLFIAVMLNRERWRYSYYRKCFIEKLERVQILLPSKDGLLDEATVASVMEATPYWAFLKTQLAAATLE